MKEKFLQTKFGICPRVLCERQAVLPIGMSEELRTSRVKVIVIYLIRNFNYFRFIVRGVKMFITQKRNVQMLMEPILDVHFLIYFFKFKNLILFLLCE